MPMMAMTTNNSTNVKPRSVRFIELFLSDLRVCALLYLPEELLITLGWLLSQARRKLFSASGLRQRLAMPSACRFEQHAC